MKTNKNINKGEMKMTQIEYDNWKKTTDKSKTVWMMDEITFRNRNEYLFYKGGVDGTYISIEKNGMTEIGYYKGALPHIGEAMFETKHNKKLGANNSEALTVVMEKLGIPFLMNFIGIS
jgi:hypothetical protein